MNTTTQRAGSALRCAATCLAVLAGVLSVLILRSGRALAAEAAITIEQQDNLDATYDAYCLFLADIDENDVATHVTWASDDAREAVLGFLSTTGYDDWLAQEHAGTAKRGLAQHAAEYLAAQIGASSSSKMAATEQVAPDGSSFASRLARHIAASSLQPQKAAQGEPFCAAEGYWLFVTSPSAMGQDVDAGTAPIWVPLGGSASRIVEKTSVPSVDKQVWDESLDAWGTVADAHVGQAVIYRLVGTLPQSFASYDTYHYAFRDHLSEGLELAVPAGSTLADSLQVTIDDTPVAIDGTSLSASLEANTLFVEFSDLKSEHWANYRIGPQSRICVTYRARLTDKAVVGSRGNPNDVVLIYTNDPVSRGEGESEPRRNKLFTYALRLRKLAQDGHSSLSGAEFVVRRTGDRQDDQALFVQKDGTLGKEPHAFVTNGEGIITLSGLDAGTYAIAETKAPEGYAQLTHEIVVSIASELDDQELALANLKASVDAGDAQVEHIDAEAGLVTLAVTNRTLPPGQTDARRLAQTGIGPVGSTLLLAGMGALGISRLTRAHTSQSRRHRRRTA